MSAVVFILVLSFLVIIHELGHFFAAKWAKVKTDEFGLGYPPKAVKLFRWKDTDFTLNWIPFGGFVRMQGEEPELENEQKNNKKPVIGQFHQATVFQKLVIILAGATVNFLFGILAFTIVFSTMGIPQTITDARIGFVAPDSPASQAGLPEQVNIIAIEYEQEVTAVATPEEVISTVGKYQGQTVTLVTTGTCTQDGCQEMSNRYQVYVRTQEEIPTGQGAMGIGFENYQLVKYPPFEMQIKSAQYGLSQAISLGWLIVQAFGDIIVNLVTGGSVSQEVAGPIGIVHQAQNMGIFDEGWLTVLSFAGMLSVNLAVMNVLPISPLDGGRAVFAILEELFTKKRIAKIEYFFNYGGYILLLGLIIVITIKDVLKIITG